MINYFEDTSDRAICPFSKVLMACPNIQDKSLLKIFAKDSGINFTMSNRTEQLSNYKQWLQAQSPSIKELS